MAVAHRRASLRSIGQRGAVLLVALLVAQIVDAGRAEAQASRGGAAVRRPKPPDLRKHFERRLKKLLGVAVSIDSLRYNLFASTFLGRGIRIGPSGRPYLRLPRLRVKVKVSLLRPGDRTIREIDASGVKVQLPLSWLGEPMIKPATRRVDVEQLQVSGSVKLTEPGRQVTLEGVEIRGGGLSAPAAKANVMPPLSGRLMIAVKRIVTGGITIGDLRLRGRLDQRTFQIDELALRVGGGEVRLKGTAGLGRRRPVQRLALAGHVVGVKLVGDAALSGKIKITGRWGRGLTVSGKLATSPDGPKLVPTKGGFSGRLPLEVRLGPLRLGKRRLSGSLRRWRLR